MPPLSHQSSNRAAKFKNKTELITIYFVTETGQSSEIQVSQRLLFAHSRVNVPIIIDFDGLRPRYDFQLLVGTGSQDYLNPLWEAFQSFVSWISTGIYANLRNKGSHIDAYMLANILESVGFANDVIRSIMEVDLPGGKYDEGLTERFRQVFSYFSPESPLRRLYFDTAVYWKLDFDDQDSTSIMFGERVLILDPIKDEALLTALRKHKAKLCDCDSDLSERTASTNSAQRSGSASRSGCSGPKVRLGRVAKSRKQSKSSTTPAARKSKVNKTSTKKAASNILRNTEVVCSSQIAPWDETAKRRYLLDV